VYRALNNMAKKLEQIADYDNRTNRLTDISKELTSIITSDYL